MSNLTPYESQPLATPLDQAQHYAEQSSSDNTKRAYRADWRQFTAWCDQHAAVYLPATPATVAAFIADEAERRKVATLERRLVAISQAHQLAGFDTPTRSEAVRRVMKGIRRTKGSAQTQKHAATLDVLREMVRSCDDSTKGMRDKAILLLGYAGALRRSELVSLDKEDCTFTEQGVILRIKRSKTDQEGQGYEKGIPYGLIAATCPVRALERWLQVAAIDQGAVFRSITKGGMVRANRLSGADVARIVKHYAELAGLDVAAFSGHSLRAGLPTDAGAMGLQERDIMEHTGHKSIAVARRYIRRGGLFRNNIAGQVGL